MIRCSATMLAHPNIENSKWRGKYINRTYMDSMYGKPDSLRAATIPTLMQIGYIKRYNVTRHACRQPLSPIDIVSVRLSRHLHDCGPPHHRIHSLLHVTGTSNALHAISRAIYAKRLTIYAIREAYIGNRWNATCVNESYQIDRSVKKDFRFI